jgi:phospholipase/carboxylesterase
MNNNLKILKTNNWVIRYRQPDGEGPHPVIWLIHGWTGDEDSMWIFASRLPDHFLLLAPRGLHPTKMGGYSWHPMTLDSAWPQIEDFQSSVDQLSQLMDDWPNSAPLADFSRFRMAGFSQGGAFVYSYAILHPDRVIALAGLAAFLPDSVEPYLHPNLFKHTPIYVSHGIRDNLVPVDRARQAVHLLEQAGASVYYCESDVGHKLSADCFQGMGTFFKGQDKGA